MFKANHFRFQLANFAGRDAHEAPSKTLTILESLLIPLPLTVAHVKGATNALISASCTTLILIEILILSELPKYWNSGDCLG